MAALFSDIQKKSNNFLAIQATAKIQTELACICNGPERLPIIAELYCQMAPTKTAKINRFMKINKKFLVKK